jgi:hypothetical protein
MRAGNNDKNAVRKRAIVKRNEQTKREIDNERIGEGVR